MIFESGKVISTRRKALGLTQEKLASVLDVDSTSVQNWEAGKRVSTKNRNQLYEVLSLEALMSKGDFDEMIEKGFKELVHVESYNVIADSGIDFGQQLIEKNETIDRLTAELEKSKDTIEKLLELIEDNNADKDRKIKALELRNDSMMKIYESSQKRLSELNVEFLEYKRSHGDVPKGIIEEIEDTLKIVKK